MASLRKRGNVWYYRVVDAAGKQSERRGCSDKRATEGMAAAAEAESSRVRSGLSDPKVERMAASERKPINAHLADFVATLTAKNGDPKHVRQTERYTLRIIDLAGIRSVSGVVPSAVMQAVGTLRGRGLSARTINAHLTAAKQFSRWLHRDGRCLDDPLAGLAKMHEADDRRVVRRPLDPPELRKLIDTARVSAPWRGMTGMDRSILYLIGAATGFRRSELASLTPASFRLDAKPPMIVCEAGFTKNGTQAEQPIAESTAAALRPWLESRPDGRPVFATLPEKTGRMLKDDLILAGIDPVDPSGRVVDMHSLRHGYITALAKAGVPIKTLQTLARHSDPKLTLNTYSHLTIHDTAAALEFLPDLTSPRPEPEALAATGTAPSITHIDNCVALLLPYARDAKSRIVADAGDTTQTTPEAGGCRKDLQEGHLDGESRVLTEPDQSAPRRTRTYNPLIKSQLLCQLS
jgi:site-specific recombinase XerC